MMESPHLGQLLQSSENSATAPTTVEISWQTYRCKDSRLGIRLQLLTIAV